VRLLDVGTHTATTSDPHDRQGGSDVADESPTNGLAGKPGGRHGTAVRQRGSRSVRRAVVVAAACAAAAVAGTVFLVVSQGNSTADAGQPGAIASGEVAVPGAQGNAHLSDTSARPVAQAPKAGAVPSSITSLGIDKAVVPLPAGHRSAVSAWAAGRGGSALSSLTVQLSDVTQLGGSGMFATMKQECGVLAADVASAQAAAPIPDAAMQAAYVRALSQVDRGASTCRSAITSWPEGNEDIQTHVNQPLLHSALASLASGARQLYLSTQQVRMLHQRQAG
jgi:hypothetical protein